MPKSPFQEQLDQDLLRVFFNPGEFAEEHLIDGVPTLCVLAAPQASSGYDPGLIGAIEMQLILPNSAQIAAFDEGRCIEIDDCRFTILRKVIEQGVAVLDLRRGG